MSNHNTESREWTEDDVAQFLIDQNLLEAATEFAHCEAQYVPERESSLAVAIAKKVLDFLRSMGAL